MLILIAGFTVIGIVFVYWAVVKSNCLIRVTAVTLALVAAAFSGYVLGDGWRRMIDYEHYIYPFSQYSSHLRNLAEHQQINELTNNVILFDSKFNPFYSSSNLQDVVFQILKVGKYYQEANATVMPQTTNTGRLTNH